jgi:hypothetical protein
VWLCHRKRFPAANGKNTISHRLIATRGGPPSVTVEWSGGFWSGVLLAILGQIPITPFIRTYPFQAADSFWLARQTTGTKLFSSAFLSFRQRTRKALVLDMPGHRAVAQLVYR